MNKKRKKMVSKLVLVWPDIFYFNFPFRFQNVILVYVRIYQENTKIWLY